MRALIVFAVLLSGCASSYNPNAAYSVQDQVRNANPHLNCPWGTVVHCDVEGGVLAGKTYSNCRCGR